MQRGFIVARHDIVPKITVGDWFVIEVEECDQRNQHDQAENARNYPQRSRLSMIQLRFDLFGCAIAKSAHRCLPTRPY
eukprot:SAG31_NODE_5831_length_2304_cov_1.903401_2_plen_78_part_00